MGNLGQAQPDGNEISRRRVLRKAAYSAPAVFAIAAAPNVALGKSGGGNNGGGGGNSGGGGGNSGGGGGNSGGTNSGTNGGNNSGTNAGTIGGANSGTVRISYLGTDPPPQAVNSDPGIGGGAAPVILALPNTGSGQPAGSDHPTAIKMATAAAVAATAAIATATVAARSPEEETADN